MSKKRIKKHRKSSEPQSKQKPLQQGKKLSRFLRQAEDCLPIDTAFKPVDQDVVFAESGHLLTRQMRTSLLVAKGILQGMERGSHFFGDDIRVPTRILYKELSVPILTQLAERGIPVEEEQPFLFDYELFGLYMPRGVRLDAFYGAFIELMLNEWKANYARKLFVGFGFEEWAKQETSATNSRQRLRKIMVSEGHELQSGLTLRTGRGLWFASEYIVRIRAQWDKLLKQLILEKMLGYERAQKLSFDEACERLQKSHERLETEYQRECLTALLTLANQTEKLRQWRDDEVHYFSQTVFGVFERKKTSESLATLWDMVIEEHDRVREAIVAMMGMVVLGPQTSSVYYTGEWPAPTRHFDFDNPDAASKNSQLVQAIKEQMKLKEEIKTASSPDELAKCQERILQVAMAAYYLVCELYGMTCQEQKGEDAA